MADKTIARFVNRKNCKKVLFNKKKLSSVDWSKEDFTQNTKIFANENLTPMNESIAYNCRKLKRSGLIHGYFSRDGIIRIKRQENYRSVKIFHKDKLHGFFPDFDFGDAGDEDDINIDGLQGSEWLSESIKLLVCGLF